MASAAAAPPDLIVTGGRILTMNARREILVEGAIAIAGEHIVEVGRATDIARRWPAADRIDAAGCIVTPGFVNGHQHHTGGPLTRSCSADDSESGASIFSWAVPIHGAHSADDDELAATVLAAEAVRNGVTTSVEAGTVTHPDRVAAGLRAVGVRGTIGTWGWDVDGLPHAASVDEVLDRQREVLDRFPAGGTVEGWVTLVGHDLASDELLAGAADLARSRGASMTMHLSPTSSDTTAYAERSGLAPAVHLDRLGVLGPHLLLGHGVWLDDDEIDAILRTDTAIAYCPWAYLRLAQGVCGRSRHAEVSRRGGRVALGCDASNASDMVDILRAGALAAGIARDTALDAAVLTAHDVLGWATIDGARAIGMADRIGSIEPGKLADLVVHHPHRDLWLDHGDPALTLVWGSDGRNVRDVVVGGEVVVRDGRCTRIDDDELSREANAASAALLARAGLSAPIKWPVVDYRTTGVNAPSKEAP